MINKNFALAMFAVVIIGSASSAIIKRRINVHHAADPIVGAIIDMQNPIDVSKIDVVSGDEFDLTLIDKRRIRAVLGIRATPEARAKMIDFIGHCKNPRVLLKNKRENVWLVHMYVTVVDASGRDIEINLADWLQQKQLAYN